MAIKIGDKEFADSEPCRIVYLANSYPVSNYREIQRNFIDPATFRTIPSTKVFMGSDLAYEVNSLGCFGPEPEPNTPIIGFFGDSTMQGEVTYCKPTIPLMTRVPGFQSINGGVEGTELAMIVRHCLDVHARRPLACAAVHSGWHNIVYGEMSFSYWRQQLDHLDIVGKVAHFRLTADINEGAVERGYEDLYRSDEDRDPAYSRGYYETQWVNSPQSIRTFKNRIKELNSFLKDYCEERGRLLIDLDDCILPRTYNDLAKNFFDAVHPRSESYEKVALAISEQLSPYMQEAPRARSRPVKVIAPKDPDVVYVGPNSIGCLGPVPDAGAAVVGFFGDTVIKGLGGAAHHTPLNFF